MPTLRVAMCQRNTVVGDLDGNLSQVVAGLHAADAAGCALAVFPELTVTGYPPEDLVGRPSFVADNLAALERIARATADTACAAVVGYVERLASAGPGERRLANALAVCAGGRVSHTYAKRRLPNYGVFDEMRWFEPGEGPYPDLEVHGVRVGVSVCEDLWYPGGPVVDQARGGARVVLNINASPYSRGRLGERISVLAERAREAGCAIVYVNQVGGQDELVFDGASLVVGPDGAVLASAPQFEEATLVVDLEVDEGGGVTVAPVPGLVSPPLAPDAEVYAALVLGTRDYVRKNSFRDVVLGLSGGIDSSLVAAVAVDALGAEHVHGVAMPSRYSSEGSLTDARALAANLGIDLREIPIEPAHATFREMLAAAGSEPAGLADENLQSRIRGVLLMALSNEHDWLVLTTGNKSEMATGYSTLYGDSAGGFAVIKDVPKMLVFELCRHRNTWPGGPVIPDSVLTKPPSAELRPNQADVQSLPPYEVLDPVLAAYVEEDRSVEELVEMGAPPTVAEQVQRLVDRAEYKRRQMPPGVRITTKAFGRDRRMPITNRYVPH